MSIAKKWKVVIPKPLDISGKNQGLLEESGCQLVLGPWAQERNVPPFSEDQLIEFCGDADAVLGATRDHYTRRFMGSVRKLRGICKYGIGVERIDVEAATDHGVIVTHTPTPENYISMAESSIAMILAMCRKIRQYGDAMKAGKWRTEGTFGTGVMLYGKTIGLVGLGRIGGAVAERLRPWGVRVLACDPYVAPQRAKELGAALTGLEELVRESDILSLHVVIVPETKGIIGERELRAMKPTAYLVNTSRGDAIDEMALIRALQEGWIAGAALDVFQQEPLRPDNPLLHMQNAMTTPHAIGATPEAVQSMVDAATQDCIRVLRGDTPRYVKNPEVLQRWRERWPRFDG